MLTLEPRNFQVERRDHGVEGRNSVVGARNSVVGARNGPVEVRNSAVGVRNSAVGARNSAVEARNSVVGSRNGAVGVREVGQFEAVVEAPKRQRRPAEIWGTLATLRRALTSGLSGVCVASAYGERTDAHYSIIPRAVAHILHFCTRSWRFLSVGGRANLLTDCLGFEPSSRTLNDPCPADGLFPIRRPRLRSNRSV